MNTFMQIEQDTVENQQENTYEAGYEDAMADAAIETLSREFDMFSIIDRGGLDEDTIEALCLINGDERGTIVLLAAMESDGILIKMKDTIVKFIAKITDWVKRKLGKEKVKKIKEDMRYAEDNVTKNNIEELSSEANKDIKLLEINNKAGEVGALIKGLLTYNNKSLLPTIADLEKIQKKWVIGYKDGNVITFDSGSMETSTYPAEKDAGALADNISKVSTGIEVFMGYDNNKAISDFKTRIEKTVNKDELIRLKKILKAGMTVTMTAINLGTDMALVSNTLKELQNKK